VVPTLFELSIAGANVTMQAAAVWKTGPSVDLLICGAEIAQATDHWRALVDAVA
jgi:hypothetical protein